MPVAPPTELVVRGLYRYVRNPMYVANLTIVVVEALWFGRFILLGYVASRQEIAIPQVQRRSAHHEMGFAPLALSILARLQDTEGRPFRLLDTD